MIYGLKRMAEHGPGWLPAVSIVAGLATGAAFVRRQRRLAHPLIDLALFRIPAFRASLITYLLATFAVFGCYVFIAQFLQLVLGLSPLDAGLWTLPFTGAFIVGSLLTPVIVRRFRPASVIATGLAVSAVGFAVLTRVDEASGLAVLVCATVIFSLGLAPVFTLTNDIVIGTAPPERAGAASAISETSSELGGALGIALLGSIGGRSVPQIDGGCRSARCPARGGGGRTRHARRCLVCGRAVARSARGCVPRRGPRGLHAGAADDRSRERRDGVGDGRRGSACRGARDPATRNI